MAHGGEEFTLRLARLFCRLLGFDQGNFILFAFGDIFLQRNNSFPAIFATAYSLGGKKRCEYSAVGPFIFYFGNVEVGWTQQILDFRGIELHPFVAPPRFNIPVILAEFL